MQKTSLQRGEWFVDKTRTLGKPGGFGQVHPGTSPDGKPVAIKIIRSDVGDAAERELEFAQGRSGMPARNLIPIFDAGIDPSLRQACIVMALADGNLREQMDGRPASDPAARLAIVADVAEGLLEAGDWIHRDLKPENILRKEKIFLISDFGIARVAEATTDINTLKHALTPPYAAPEQWKGVRATHATDIYALGCIAVELLTGQRPFAGPNEEDYERQHQFELPTILNVPTRIRTLLLKMLAKQASARPSIENVITEIATIRNQPAAKPAGAEILNSAAAFVAEQTAKQEAADAAAKARIEERRAVAVHGLELLTAIADHLFSEIAEHAPGARIEKPKQIGPTVYRASLGNAEIRITLGQYKEIPERTFAGSEWDVVCGDGIAVQWTKYTRSASLWYADVGRKGKFEWIEMGYWAIRENLRNIPTHLTPGKDAALAASRILHTWRHAHPVRVIEGDGLEPFCQRWMSFFGEAIQGKLRVPNSLPESK